VPKKPPKETKTVYRDNNTGRFVDRKDAGAKTGVTRERVPNPGKGDTKKK
jgi:hypothetical protein